MVYIALHDDKTRPLSFYLAMEEYIARSKNLSEDAFFMWQVEPSVIFGRNQDIFAEVNIDYCREQGINMFRRKSGGGCVYADRSNVMLSYITKAENVENTFCHYLSLIKDTLSKMGIEATSTSSRGKRFPEQPTTTCQGRASCMAHCYTAQIWTI